MLRLSAEKLAVTYRKLYEIELLTCTCRWSSAHAKQVLDTKFFTYWGGDRKKSVTDTANVFKKDQKLLKTRGYPYFLCYEVEVASLLNT